MSSQNQQKLLWATGIVGLCTALGLWYKIREHKLRVKKERDEASEYDMIIDVVSAPDKVPWHVEIRTAYEKDIDALGVCVLGDFKVGKTFLINHLCNLNLCSIESHHTKGLSFKRGKVPRHQVVWIDTAGHGCPYDTHKETAGERTSVENLLGELAYRLADVRIIVVSNCKLRDQEFIFSVHKKIKNDCQPGKDLLIVVHNYARIQDPDMLESAFKNDVVSRFDIQEVYIPYRRSDNSYKRLWVDRSDPYPIYHLYLGKEGTPAGDRWNEMTFNAIFDLCVDRVGYNVKHNFIEDTVELTNSGMLSKHLNCNYDVKYDEKLLQIVVDEQSNRRTTNDALPGLTHTQSGHSPSMQPQAMPHTLPNMQRMPAYQDTIRHDHMQPEHDPLQGRYSFSGHSRPIY